MVGRRLNSEVIDLHGLSTDVAIQTFISRANKLCNAGHRGWVTVVHGYGSTGVGGVIKQRIRALLNHHADAYESRFNDALNPGSTEVRILKTLPLKQNPGTPLEEQVLLFCTSPKEESKICNKFHRRPITEIKEIIRQLQSRGLLMQVAVNGRKSWKTVGEATVL